MSDLLKPLRWFGLCLVLAFALVKMPARAITLMLPDTLQLEGFSGSLWQGHAARARFFFGDKAFHLGRLSWNMSPATFLIFTPSLDLHTRWGTQTADLRLQLTPSTIKLSEIDATLDVRFVRQLVPLYAGGLLLVDLDYLQIARDRAPQIGGSIMWEQAVWTARGRDVGLGNYKIVFDASSESQLGPTVGKITTASGALVAKGQVTLSSDKYGVEVALSGPAMENNALRDALQLMAVPSEEGLLIEISGEL